MRSHVRCAGQPSLYLWRFWVLNAAIWLSSCWRRGGSTLAVAFLHVFCRSFRMVHSCKLLNARGVSRLCWSLLLFILVLIRRMRCFGAPCPGLDKMEKYERAHRLAVSVWE